MRNQSLILGLGSNLGVPLENLRTALAALRRSSFFRVKAVSGIYESAAQLPPGAASDWQRTFLNAAVECECISEALPEDILAEIKKIETTMGRERAEIWAPRLIDIDILYWNRPSYVSEKLRIPHAQLLERPFALLPLLELCAEPDLELPLWSRGWITEKPFATVRSRRYFWPRFVGILNVTADSFSDGGKYTDPKRLLEQAENLLTAGAEILDIGAESTRPGAVEAAPAQELTALNLALDEIKKAGLKTKISLDCRHSEVAARAMERHQIDYLNDVTGFSDPGMQKLLAQSTCSAFVMHSLSVPPKKELLLTATANPCVELLKWWKMQREALLQLGIGGDRLIFDPGIGFGKSIEQNFYILENLEEFFAMSEEIMIGHSRKSFLKILSDRKPEDRDAETSVVTANLNQAFVQYLRVHDVQSQRAAL